MKTAGEKLGSGHPYWIRAGKRGELGNIVIFRKYYGD